MPSPSIAPINKFKLSVDGLVQPNPNQKLIFKNNPPKSPAIKNRVANLSTLALNNNKLLPKIKEIATSASPYKTMVPKIWEFGIAKLDKNSLKKG
ncbi:MAG: hypothetical protein UT77_C0012G0005 [Candidatus Daviesbacteria bacterium GW2011_GWC2_40_12]|uniref:Uncharacterized protein n=1 Tax=Candidatus Daviesbacteria bacterium GW2011_GWC2_40_12 TaxID=1618431 RepID=A0A0G0QMJ7_9BACT|nr:MAG: hypothetical protein UT04_C0022G0005 [Candidatus Daviesbacteria bacterium GW2011_GWF2_38_7]KKR41378.1 MAG: hypothetical protein UT77_C0012G0005 [Candidatus Daviesbacteria bacterium GW2011_GWC2_40_12]